MKAKTFKEFSQDLKSLVSKDLGDQRTVSVQSKASAEVKFGRNRRWQVTMCIVSE